MMTLISQMVGCLLVAAGIGFTVGWYVQQRPKKSIDHPAQAAGGDIERVVAFFTGQFGAVAADACAHRGRAARSVGAVVVDRQEQPLTGRTVACWGLSFKPRTDDMREAPSLTIIESLLAMGATVRVHDPEALKEAKKHFGDQVEYNANQYEILAGAGQRGEAPARDQAHHREGREQRDRRRCDIRDRQMPGRAPLEDWRPRPHRPPRATRSRSRPRAR